MRGLDPRILLAATQKGARVRPGHEEWRKWERTPPGFPFSRCGTQWEKVPKGRMRALSAWQARGRVRGGAAGNAVAVARAERAPPPAAYRASNSADLWYNIARCHELIAQGATAGKWDPFGEYPGPDRQLPTSTLNEVREMVRGVREAGPSFDICVEAHGKFNLATAGRIIKMLEPFDVFFLEEPVPPENSKQLFDALQAKKIPAKYLELPSGGHGLDGYKGPMWDAWQQQSLAWLAELKFIPAKDAERK